LARSNSIDLRETLRQERQQIFKAIRFGTQNHDRNFSASQILLVLDTLIHGEENIESGWFRRRQKFAIPHPSQSGITSSLAVVGWERIPKPLIETFVEQNAHLGARKQEMLGLFERREGRFARDGREAF
jgi:hypothetical protein